MIKSNTPPSEAIARKYIVNVVRVLVLAAFVVAMAQNPVAQAEEWQEINIVNESGRTITGLFFSSDGGNSWSKDLLGNQTLPDGYNIDVYYNAEIARKNYYSVYVIYDNDENDYAQWDGFDFEGVTQLEFNSDGTASAT